MITFLQIVVPIVCLAVLLFVQVGTKMFQEFRRDGRFPFGSDGPWEAHKDKWYMNFCLGKRRL
jgi:hypothetical protein